MWPTAILPLLIGTLSLARGEIFTAMADMESLLYAEKDIIGVIDQYIQAENERLQKLKNFALEYQSRNKKALRDGTEFLMNPLNAYLVVKRLTSDWEYVESLMKHNAAEGFLQNITDQRQLSAVKFPDSEDLKGAAVALLRLQDTYKLETSDMAKGKIRGVAKATDELTAHDCFELGRVAYNQGDHYHVILWMQEALNRAYHERNPSATEADILEYLAFSMYQQGNIRRAIKLTKRLMQLVPDHPRAEGNVKYYSDLLAGDGVKKADGGELPPVVNQRAEDRSLPERVVYEGLCRGEYTQDPKKVAKYFCGYKTDTPFLRLARLKYEVVHLRPKITIFRGVISDEEIETVKKLATPKLQRATVQDPQTGQLVHASYRVQKSSWLKEDEHPVVARINKRLGDITNLEMETAEELQVANYGIGGHYDPHFDFARVANYGLGGHYEPHFDMSTKEEKGAFEALGTGNRIATVLFYMSTPEAGGGTVFSELKVSLWPTKHDAAFWMNLRSNGEGDLTTRHAACPVLAGQKWVSNKWIHERGQEFKRPCALDANEYE